MKNFVSGALAAGFLCACGTVAVRVPVMKPAEINMAPYQSVAVGEMTGSGNHPMTGALEEALVNTNRFTVVDRQHMEQVMREGKRAPGARDVLHDMTFAVPRSRIVNSVLKNAFWLASARCVHPFRPRPSVSMPLPVPW